MKTKLHRMKSNLRPALFAALTILGLPTFSLIAQTDSFDNPMATATNWLHITATNYPAVYSFSNDLSGGFAYRLQGVRPAGQIAGFNTARAIAYRTNQVYTNFFVAADILAWGAPNSSNGNIFGLCARANNLDSGLGRAITFTVEPNRWYKTASDGSRGVAALYLSDFYDDTCPASVPSAVANCTLAEGRAYRMVLTGISNVFTAAIYDLEDLTRPVLLLRGDDRFQCLEQSGNWPVSGYSGIFNVSGASGRADEDQTTDTTFDNFVASGLPPTSVAAPGTPHGLAGVAQVVNRSPTSFSNFYPAAGGITFNATTLTTTNTVNTNAIKLFLNGVDVSSGLSITGPTTNAVVSYNGLTSNAVYDARIELQDALGRKTTNAWTFDTFSDAYLTNALAKNIEAEDWDFDGGSFIDNPPPSGFPTNSGTPVNDMGVGYFDLVGTADVDFQVLGNPATADGHDFRTHISELVATQQGNFGNAGNSEGPDMYSTIDGDPNHPSGYYPVRFYPAQRQKYIDVDPALHEYFVRHTEATGVAEWMNYTRILTNTSYYNVYLRHACGSPQSLLLDAAPTNTGPFTNLGTFTMPSYTTVWNFRYTPLLDGSNKLAVVNLSGTNTLRLTVPPPYSNAKRYNLSLNYMAFVPALLVESAAAVTGPYALETGAIVEPGTRRVTIPANGSKRFYRVRWDHQVTITSVKLVGGNVSLTYQ